MKRWLIMSLLLCPLSAAAQDPNEPGPPSRRDDRSRIQVLRQRAMRLIGTLKELGDWQEHYGYMVDATERVFERNGWDSESDLFSLELVREVGQIPPWNTLERFDRAMGMIGDRYLLDEEQTTSLRRRAIGLNIELFSRHSDRIMKYAVEAVQTRAAGEPFTPEQVARWTKLAEPVFRDAQRSINAAAKDFMEELDPEQRELFERDLEAGNRRLSDLERMAQQWKRGEWDPHDWGMEEDPIQSQAVVAVGAAPAREAGAGATGAGESVTGRERAVSRERRRTPVRPEPAGRVEGPAPRDARSSAEGKPEPDDPWAKYVRAFIGKYHLNDEQRQRAWLIYGDAKERDQVFERRYQRQVQALREKVGNSSGERTQAALRERAEKHQRERERLFNLLKRRLERLPTRAQRRNAEPADIPEPVSSTTRPARRKKP
jgi:hypothetical protein